MKLLAVGSSGLTVKSCVNDECSFVICTARQTGDHRLAEEGSLPSPSDLLTAQANSHGYGCHRVYRLRPDGLMACEDTDVNKMVAITRNIDTDSTVCTIFFYLFLSLYKLKPRLELKP